MSCAIPLYMISHYPQLVVVAPPTTPYTCQPGGSIDITIDTGSGDSTGYQYERRLNARGSQYESTLRITSTTTGKSFRYICGGVLGTEVVFVRAKTGGSDEYSLPVPIVITVQPAVSAKYYIIRCAYTFV
jgi:hypothetical protein